MPKDYSTEDYSHPASEDHKFKSTYFPAQEKCPHDFLSHDWRNSCKSVWCAKCGVTKPNLN